MTDTDKLKRLAEAATRGPWNYDGEGVTDDGSTYREVSSSAEIILGEYGFVSAENAKYIAAANPQAILALIAENERLNAVANNVSRFCEPVALIQGGTGLASIKQFEKSPNFHVISGVSCGLDAVAKLTADRDEAVALLREFMDEGDTSSVYNDVLEFLARIDTKDAP